VRFARYYPDRAESLVVYRHPAQLYEALLGVGILIALFIADRAWGMEKRPRGALISVAAAGYFGGRFLLEFFKEYQAVEPGSWLTMGQWLSLPCALFALWVLKRSLAQQLPAGWTAR
jgi:prolipoprotein diacylglyceryltransferase